MATQLLLVASGSEGAAYLNQLEVLQKELNPLFGTPEFEKQQKELKKQQSRNGNTLE